MSVHASVGEGGLLRHVVIGPDDGEGVNVISGKGGRHMVFYSGDGETTEIDSEVAEGHIWVSPDSARRSASRHLEESGALDGLDEATRERILEELKAYEAAHRQKHVILVEALGEDDSTI